MIIRRWGLPGGGGDRKNDGGAGPPSGLGKSIT
nr:MAG TPA: hypothetical protein [Caudoviricetes sp.]